MTAEGVEGISLEELQLAARNHGMPLEALRWPITPIGLHYLLTHYDIPCVDPDSWRVRVGGRVRHELSLSLDELRGMPRVRMLVTFECAGNGRARLLPRPISQPWLSEAVGTAEWTGTPLRAVLDEAGVMEDAVEVVFAGLDHGLEGDVEQDYERALQLPDAMEQEVLLAYEVNGAPLPPQHGYPLRLVVPGWYGMTNVKWLSSIRVTAQPFEGYQQARGYRFRREPDEEGEAVTRMMPRALMVPPGFPEFMSRKRMVPTGSHTISGRAWSGWGRITRVEVSTDAGSTWVDAGVDAGPSPFAWSAWTCDWLAQTPGEIELRCRATDEAGNTQPDEPAWNVGGYANNAVQRVPVTVIPAG